MFGADIYLLIIKFFLSTATQNFDGEMFTTYFKVGFEHNAPNTKTILYAVKQRIFMLVHQLR